MKTFSEFQEQIKTGGTIKKPTVIMPDGKELPGLGGGGGGTDAITAKAKTKTFKNRVKDVGKILTFPISRRNVKPDPTEKFATEDTAIESELTIQDWNSDDIKFTEIETVDIIKAKPLLDEKYQFLKKAFGKAIILGTGASKAMGKSPRLSRKGSISLTTGKALKGFKDAIQKVKDLKQVQKMSDAPAKFPRDTQIIKIKKRTSPNAIFPTKANVKIKNEIISPDGISTKNPIKKKFNKDIKDHYDWRADLDEDWQKVNRKDKTDGLSKAAVKAYRRENPGSKLQTAVTKDPKKLKKGSKSAKRRLSFCRRMKGMKKKLTSAKTRRDPDSRINKALRRWNC